MKNPWLEIPLSDYEAHMALPEVGQARVLSDILADWLDRYHPESVAVLGCAGGNGFDRIPAKTRVVAIDLNPSYIDRLSKRFRDRFQCLELIVGDMQTIEMRFAPVDFVFAGLVFEYVDVGAVLNRLSSVLRPGGILGTIVQPEMTSRPMVTPSPFKSLERLTSIMRPMAAGHLKRLAEQHGLQERQSRVINTNGGKQLVAQEFWQSAPNKVVNPSDGSGGF